MINPDYQLRTGETPDQYSARLAALNLPNGLAPAPENTPDIINGATGAPVSSYDELAKQYGYDSFDAFTQTVFQKPSKNTQQLYQEAYNAAGLPDLLNKLTSSKTNLTAATGKINENPWLDEASRVGRSSRLQQLANGEISNLQDEYNLRLDQVRDLVQRHSEDLTNDQRLNEARLNFLLKQAEGKAQQQTVELGAGSTLVRLNPQTGEYEQVATGLPKEPTTPASYQEYLLAKQERYKGSYMDYQNADANRKRSVTNVNVENSRELSDILKLLQIQSLQGGNATQQTNANYASRLTQSAQVIDANAAAYAKLGTVGQSTQSILPNFLKSDLVQSQEQAERNFLNAVLRRESGAVISPSEFTEGAKQYFPRPGDSATVLQQKKANRDLVTRNFISSSGLAYQSPVSLNDSSTQSASTEDLDYTIKQNQSKYSTREQLIDAIVKASGMDKNTVASRVYKIIPDKN